MDQFSSPAPEMPKKFWQKRSKKIYILVLAGVFLFCAGFFIGHDNQDQAVKPIEKAADQISNLFAGNKRVDPSLFTEVWNYLHQDYVDRGKIDDTALFYGALRGMVDAVGDPHTIFMDPKLSEEFNRELDGVFSGIGAEIGHKNNQLVIVAALPGTPSEKAGLKSGDVILAVDDKDATQMSVEEAVSLIRGQAGTEIKLTILSKDEQKAKEVTLLRARIEVPSVTYKLNQDRIAIITISNFDNNVGKQFTKAAQKALNDNPRGLIVDLRNNPGGYLTDAINISSAWLEPDQVVVREVFADTSRNLDHRAIQTLSLANFKTVVLINAGSASASEILAGALQDYGKATIIGIQSFGKGTVQQLISMDNSALKLTIARWLTPRGRTIEGEGITPDIVVDLSTEDYNNDRDPQLDKAVESILSE